jgi:chromosome segregation ATPase
MAGNELEKALQTLTDALDLSEAETTEEIKLVDEQINELREKIIELKGKQEILAHDRTSISEMFQRYVEEDKK